MPQIGRKPINLSRLVHETAWERSKALPKVRLQTDSAKAHKVPSQSIVYGNATNPSPDDLELRHETG
jgi:hypothetical protein